MLCNPGSGNAFDSKLKAALYREALAKAGMSPAAVQARGGHASHSATQTYVDLAGERPGNRTVKRPFHSRSQKHGN